MDSDDALVRARWEHGDRPSTELVSTVATLKGCEPTQLDPLQETIEVDALDALLTSNHTTRAGSIQVTFPFAGYQVSVSADGSLTVWATDPTRE